MRLATLLLALATIPAPAEEAPYRKLIEAKYGAPLERFEVVDLSATTKVLWFDWESHWWGGFNVIETGPEGAPLFWYDLANPPTAQSVERIRAVKHGDRTLLEVIDCTHMGNGFLYLYEVRKGRVKRLLRARVITTLDIIRFHPRIAKVRYEDLNGDGELDVVIDAMMYQFTEHPEVPGSNYGTYHREFLSPNGGFVEQRDKRLGPKNLMD